MKITVRTIPHLAQRYDTVGDWLIDPEGNIDIYVSNTDSWKSELLVAVHEIIEAALCKDRGISEAEVTAFDVCHPELEDPGLDKRAPYHLEHLVATDIEHQLANELNVDWEAHNSLLYEQWTPPKVPN